MWVYIALLSAAFLGIYDVSKKSALKNNAVMPVLWFNTLFCSVLMTPFLIISHTTGWLDNTLFYLPDGTLQMHLHVFVKASIVLASWVCGYFGMKHLPITLYGPVNATRPILVLLGGLLIFQEKLNLYQWIGVIIAVISFYMLSVSGKKEGIDFKRNKWIICTILATLLGAVSAMYDKYLMGRFSNMFVQAWSNYYQLLIMTVLLFVLWYPQRRNSTPFRWKWSILQISLFLTAADYAYFFALTQADSMISIVSMIRRSSVIVSFLFGAMVFKEKNLKSKAVDLILVLFGLFFLFLGSL